MISAKAFMYFAEEDGSFLFSNASKEGSANTYLLKGVICEMVAPGMMLDVVECNWVIRFCCSSQEG